MASVKGDAGSSNPLVPDSKYGVWGQSDFGYGVAGTSNSGSGVKGSSINGIGTIGISEKANGVYGRSDREGSEFAPGGIGVMGENNLTLGIGVNGQADDQGGIGVKGVSINGIGTVGISKNEKGVYGRSDKEANSLFDLRVAGVKGENNSAYGIGVNGQANGFGGIGVEGIGGSFGVVGRSISTDLRSIILYTTGVFGQADDGVGVEGRGRLAGVVGRSDSTGVEGISFNGSGVFGSSSNVGVFAHNGSFLPTPTSAYLASRCCAGDFYGNVAVHGQLQLFKPGQAFKIDHPLDPANKYLSHSFVQSPDMKNVYDGVVVIDAEGKAVVQLPDWFEALNENFCYQLTSIGTAGPNLYIAEEINNNCFTIAGGVQGMKVSWQVTGTRKDVAANEANQIKVEEEKPENERGYYLHPGLYNEPVEKGIKWARYPEQINMLEDERNRLKNISEHEEKSEGPC
jgi:hypothetical protein